MRIIVAGSRDFKNYFELEKNVLGIVDELKSQGYDTNRDSVEIISGTARGADQLGELFALNYGLKLIRFPAKWEEFGKKAGYLRNAEMSKYARQDEELGVLIAFWNGSRGTKHMIDLATKDGLRVYVVEI